MIYTYKDFPKKYHKRLKEIKRDLPFTYLRIVFKQLASKRRIDYAEEVARYYHPELNK